MIEVLLQAESALSLGLLDQAEILYRQVVIADPRNSIAVVGLARVALERGDEPGALAQARRALAIDGENAAAQRMVHRLEEVLAYRAFEARARDASAPASVPASARAPMGDGPGAASQASQAAAPPVTDPTAPPVTDPAAPLVPDPAAPPIPAETRSWLDRITRRAR